MVWRAFNKQATGTLTPYAVTVPSWLIRALGYKLSRWDSKTYRLWCVCTIHGVDTLVLNLFRSRTRRAVPVYVTSKSHRYARTVVRGPVMQVMSAKGSRKLRHARLTVVGYYQNCIALRLYAKHS